jgi:hypothetical protein
VVRIERNALRHRHYDAATAARTLSGDFWFLRERLP